MTATTWVTPAARSEDTTRSIAVDDPSGRSGFSVPIREEKPAARTTAAIILASVLSRSLRRSFFMGAIVTDEAQAPRGGAPYVPAGDLPPASVRADLFDPARHLR